MIIQFLLIVNSDVLDHTDVGQVTISFVKVQTVADDKPIVHGKPDVVNRDIGYPVGLLIDQSADPQAGRLAV
jgi:hypothetical protein